MNCIIDGFDFYQINPMRYYAPPASWSTEKKKDNAINKIFSGSWWGSRKVDGIMGVCGKNLDGEIFWRPRAKNTKGEFVNKIEWLPQIHDFLKDIDPGTVFLCETYIPAHESAKDTTSVLNCLLPKSLKRQENEEYKLHIYIFDILADGGESYLNMKAIDRFLRVEDYSTIYNNSYVEWAKYYNGKELWDMLQHLLANGYEGMVITREDAPYQPGKRSNSVSLKIKKEIQETIDCVIIGANSPSTLYTGKEVETWPYWFNNLTHQFITADEYLAIYHTNIYVAYNEGMPVEPVTKNYFYGWAGSLKLGLYDGDKLVHVGDLSGIDEEVRQNWKNYVGTVVEISCMEIHDTGGLRHPRAINWMRDKNPKDCSIGQIR